MVAPYNPGVVPLALIGNLSLMETVVVAVIAILVFGKRLPEVAVRAVRWMQGLRRSLDDLRRETGLDAELRSVERSIESVAREARIEDPMRLPPEPRAERRMPTGRPQESAPADPPPPPQPGVSPEAQASSGTGPQGPDQEEGAGSRQPGP